MTIKEHDYVIYLINSVWNEIDYDEDTFLNLDIDKITSELNDHLKDLQEIIKEGIKWKSIFMKTTIF